MCSLYIFKVFFVSLSKTKLAGGLVNNHDKGGLSIMQNVERRVNLSLEWIVVLLVSYIRLTKTSKYLRSVSISLNRQCRVVLL